MYRRRDVESVVRIKQLLYEEGYTIAGARQHLRDEGKGDKNQVALPFMTGNHPPISARFGKACRKS